MIKEIYEKVNDIMDSLVGENQPLAVVYGYPEAQPDLFPCAMMDVDAGITQEDLASHAKWLTVNIIVRVLIRQQNMQAVTEQRMEIMDAVIQRFTEPDVFDDLGGVADIMDIPTIEPIFIASQADQPLFGFDIIVRARKVMVVS